MNRFIILLFLSIGLAYSQCDDLLESQCLTNSSCEWVITGSQTYSCSGFGNQSSCENYSEYGCSWEFSWGGWQNYGSSCVGGSFLVDSGICEEVEVLECSDMNQNECLNDESCEWVEDVQSGWCGSFNNNSTACNSIDSCSYTTCQQACNWSGSAECESYPGCSYSYLTYSCSGTTTVPCCSGGSYQIDNSYCQEIEVLECSDMNQLQCGVDSTCEWVENQEWGSCSNLSPYMNNGVSYCNDPSTNTDQCYTYTCYGGYYGQWNVCCGGGDYLISNNSYCDELSFIYGDVNGDGLLNVSDIVLMVDFILSAEYNLYADFNQDGILNVIDIVELVNRILNG